MKRYEVRLSPRASKDLKKLPIEIQKTIWGVIDLLADNPLPPAARKIKTTDLYRVRVGNYRIIYSFTAKILLVNVVKIGHRKNVYEYKRKSRIDSLVTKVLTEDKVLLDRLSK